MKWVCEKKNCLMFVFRNLSKVLLVFLLCSSSAVGLETPFLSSGTNIGGGNESIDFVATWCQEAVSTLKEHKESAKIQVHQGNYHTASLTLVSGLVRALEQSQSENNYLFTYKALLRGLSLAEFLDVGRVDKSSFEKEATYNLLRSYYDFVIETVARDLDFDVYIPYLRCVDCELHDADHFERRFVNYVVKQLSYIQRTLVNVIHREGYIEITPIGPESYYLKSMEFFAQYTAEDLKNSLWKQRFSCVISELKSLNGKLQHYNQGNTSLYPDSRIAVNMVGNQVYRIISRLRTEANCYY